jgi:hypothetical protein
LQPTVQGFALPGIEKRLPELKLETALKLKNNCEAES